MIKTKPYDVFISHRNQDKAVAEELARVLQSHDLQVFTDADIIPAKDLEDEIWEAMAESQAMVAIISDGEPNAWMEFEVGAAKAWNKPIYGLVVNPSSRMPVTLKGLLVYPVSRIDELARDIKRSAEALSDAEADALIDEYRRVAVPVDRLALQPQQLAALTKRFQKRTNRQVSGEQVLGVLFRLRKRHVLPRVSKKNGR